MYCTFAWTAQFRLLIYTQYVNDEVDRRARLYQQLTSIKDTSQLTLSI